MGHDMTYNQKDLPEVGEEVIIDKWRDGYGIETIKRFTKTLCILESGERYSLSNGCQYPRIKGKGLDLNRYLITDDLRSRIKQIRQNEAEMSFLKEKAAEIAIQLIKMEDVIES